MQLLQLNALGKEQKRRVTSLTITIGWITGSELNLTNIHIRKKRPMPCGKISKVRASET